MNFSDRSHDNNKKIGQYSYASKDAIGKGYSSVVYRGHNESNGISSFTQDRSLLLNSSI